MMVFEPTVRSARPWARGMIFRASRVRCCRVLAPVALGLSCF